MRSRFRIVLASALAIVSGACAAATSTGGTGGGAGPVASDLPQGEQPVENAQTREADRQLGLAMLASGEAAEANFRAALAATEQAIATDPRNPLPWKQAGDAYVGLGDYERADSVLDEAESLRPIYKLEIDVVREQAWIALYNEGADVYNTGDLEEAAEIWGSANTIYDQRPEIMLFLGQVQMELGRHDEAADNLRNALSIIQSDRINEMDSATAESWRTQLEPDIPPLLAQALMNAERYEEAVGTLRPLVDADPSNAAYVRSLANLYAQLGQTDSARVVFQRMEATAGANLTPFDYFVIGTGYYDMDEFMSAANSFGSALRIAPRDRDAAEWRTRALFDLVQEQEEAGATPDPSHVRMLVEAAEAWAELDPNSQTAHTILAQALNKGGEADDRVVEVIETLETLPFYIENLALRRGRPGGGMVSGDLRNVSMEAGQTVAVRFTFYGADGSMIGSQVATVRLPPQQASGLLEVDFQSAEEVHGYTYEVMG
jgi:tetratricopeptide (TPR) repeat protein